MSDANEVEEELHLVDVQLRIPDGDDMLCVISVRLKADGNFAFQHHNSRGPNGDRMTITQLSAGLRWLADRLEIEAL